MPDKKIYDAVETSIGEKIRSLSPMSGGSISTAYKAHLHSDKEIFIKISPQFNDMFMKEANGLRELQKANAIRVPTVVFVNSEILILELIPTAKFYNRKLFFEIFGRQFAQLHFFTNNLYGFYENNYIGSTPQINMQSVSWKEFFVQHRLEFQFHLAEKNGFADTHLSSLFSKLIYRIDELIPNDGEKPALLHGDLWSGNFLADEHGSPVIIDPAVYYGHREADLAMTMLFGGFDEQFYSAYHEVFPLTDGWKRRIELYKLYHLFNHLNLFGEGYYSQVLSVLRFLTL
jgi:fructosamine-3-kinase